MIKRTSNLKAPPRKTRLSPPTKTEFLRIFLLFFLNQFTYTSPVGFPQASAFSSCQPSAQCWWKIISSNSMKINEVLPFFKISYVGGSLAYVFFTPCFPSFVHKNQFFLRVFYGFRKKRKSEIHILWISRIWVDLNKKTKNIGFLLVYIFLKEQFTWTMDDKKFCRIPSCNRKFDQIPFSAALKW